MRPAKSQGTRGFRFWITEPGERYVPCDCGWAPHLSAHYKVRRGHPTATTATELAALLAEFRAAERSRDDGRLSAAVDAVGAARPTDPASIAKQIRAFLEIGLDDEAEPALAAIAEQLEALAAAA